MLGSGLQTSATVTINVGVKKNASFASFEKALADLKASLREVSTKMGLGDDLRAAQTSARQLAAQQKKLNAQNAANKIRANDRANAQIAAQNNRANIAAAQQYSRTMAAQQRASSQAVMRQAKADAASRKKYYDQTDKEINAARTAREKAAATARLALNRQIDANVAMGQKAADRGIAMADEELTRQRINNANKVAMAEQQAARAAMTAWEEQYTTLSNEVNKKTLLGRIDDAVSTGKITNQMGQTIKIDPKLYEKATRGLRSWIDTIDPARASSQQFVAALNNIVAAESKAEQHSAMMGKSLQYRLDHFEKQLDAIFRAGFRLQMVGMDLMNIGHRIQAAFEGVMKTFGDFQYTMNRAAATMGMFDRNATGMTITLGDLQEGLLQLSRESRLFPAHDVAEALYYWASATGEVINSNEDLRRNMTALEPIMKAAAMTNTDYETTIKGVYSIIAQFYNGDVTEATHVTEELFYVTQKTAVEFNDLINSFKMLGPVAAQNNTSFEETAQLLGEIGDLGIRGTMAGRALRQMFIQMARPSGPAFGQYAELFAAAGLMDPTRDKNGKLSTPNARQVYNQKFNPGGMPVGAASRIHELAKMLTDAKYTEAQRNTFLATVTTANELPVLTALIIKEQKAILGLDKTTKDYRTTAEKAHQYFVDNWNAMAESWNGVAGSLQRAWEHLQIQLGSSIAEVLTPLFKKFTDMIEKVRQWVRANPAAVQAISKLAAGFGVLATAAGAVFTALGTFIGLAAGITLVARTMQTKLAPAASVFAVISAAVMAVADNIDYVSGRFEEAATIIRRSFAQNEEAVSSFAKTFQQATNIIRDIFGTIIRTGADAMVVIAKFTSYIMELNQTIPILDAVKTALLAIFAYKTIGLITAAGSAILNWAKNLRIVKVAMTEFSLAAAAMTERGAGAGLISYFGALRTAITPLSALLVGLSVAFAAKETDFGGFGHWVDQITNSFRDLDKELREMRDSWDSISGIKLGLVASNFAKMTVDKRIIGSIRELTDAERDLVNQQMHLNMPKMFGAFDMNNPLFTQGSMIGEKVIPGLMEAFVGGTPEQVRAGIQSYVNDRIKEAEVEFEKALPGVMDDVNAFLVSKGKDPVSQQAFIDSFLSFVPDLSHVQIDKRSLGLQADVTRFILEAVGERGTSRQALEGIAKEINDAWGQDAGEVLVGGTLNSLIDYVGSAAASNQVLIDQRQKIADAYKPVMESINNILANATFDEMGNVDIKTQMALGQALVTPFNGLDSIAQLVANNENVPEVVTSFYQNMLKIINPEVEAQIEDLGKETGKKAIDVFFKAMTDSKNWRKDIVNQYKNGTDIQRLHRAIRDIFSLKGNTKSFWSGLVDTRGNTQLRNAVKNMYDGIASMFEEYKASHPGASRKALTSFLTDQIPTVADLRREGLSGGRARRVVREIHRQLAPIYHALGRRAPWEHGTPKPKPKPGDGGFVPVLDSFGPSNQKPPVFTPKVDTSKVDNAAQQVAATVTAVNAQLDSIPAHATSVGQQTVTNFSAAFATDGKEGNAAVNSVFDWASEVYHSMDDLVGWANDLGKSVANSFRNTLFGYYKGGESPHDIGAAWGASFTSGVQSTIMDSLKFIGMVYIGNSPPKMGPLKDIDKGGYNVGYSYGESFGRGTRVAMTKSLNETRMNMYKASLSPEANVTYKSHHERKLKIDVDIKSSDGTATRKTQAEIRRSAIEALSLSEVSHLASVT